MTIERIAVLGAGAWGTALAVAACRAGSRTLLWARSARQAARMAETRENAARLPGIALPGALEITADPAGLREAQAWLLAIPAQALRGRLEALAEVAPPDVALVICAKGIERHSGLLLDAVAGGSLPGRPVAVLSGPTFADEVARGLPAAISLATPSRPLGEALRAAVGSSTFRPYLSQDVTGVLLGGAIKNVIGLASGIVAGRGYGENARAALLTRGLAEMARLGRSLGAEPETLMGLAGLGDLILTGTSAKSRNYSHGLALARGEESGGVLVEGAATAAALLPLAERHGLELPIAASVAAVLAGEMSIDDAVDRLLSRPFRDETA